MMDERFTSRSGVGAASMLTVIAMAGCALPPGEDGSRSTIDARGNGVAVSADTQSIVEAATRDVASRLSIDAKAVEIVSTAAVNWSDGSLGCPADGMMYTQALVPGYRVILRAGGQTFDYHAAANGHFVLCPPERAIDPMPAQPI